MNKYHDCEIIYKCSDLSMDSIESNRNIFCQCLFFDNLFNYTTKEIRNNKGLLVYETHIPTKKNNLL